MRVPPEQSTGMDAGIPSPEDQEGKNELEETSPQDQTEKDRQYYHIDEGPTTLYEASENQDGSWTITSQEGETTVLLAEEFHINYLEYQAPGESASLEPGDRTSEYDFDTDDEPDQASEAETPDQINLDAIQDLNAAKAAIQSLHEQLMRQQGQAAVPAGTSEQRISSAAERLITGLAALGTGLFKGVGKVVGSTVDQLNAWQGQQRLLEIQGHVTAAKSHLETIRSDPDFVKEMGDVSAGIKSEDDARSALFERFTNTDPEIAGSDLNRAYHRMLSEMKQLSDLDYPSAMDKIDLGNGTHKGLAAKVNEELSDLLSRDELDVLPDANNESLRKSAEEMVTRIQEFFRRLLQRFTNQPLAQEEPGMSPS